MKVFLCLFVALSASMAAPSSSSGGPQSPGVPQAQSSSQSSSAIQQSSQGSQGGPSQVANKRGDTDFATAASQQQPVYSPSISQQQSSSHSQSASPSDYQSSASNGNLYYYYYPTSQHSAGKSDSSLDPYQASAASSYPSYSSEGSSPQHSSYDSSPDASVGYGSSASYQNQLQAYAAAAAQAAQQHQGGPSYSQYGPSLVGSSSQVNTQYATPGGVPVQTQAAYGTPGGSAYQPGGYQLAPASDGKSRFYGLGSVIMPLVGLGALAFLLPSVTNLGGKKKTKRSTDSQDTSKANNIAEYAERLEKLFKAYRAVSENEECMNRVVCEVGDSVSTVRGKAAILALFEKVAPQWMTGKIGVFKYGALTDKSSKCARYKC